MNLNITAIPHIISKQKTVTTSTVQGSSSSSSSTVTRTFITSSTTYHSQSTSNHFGASETLENPTVCETIKRMDQLSIKQPSEKISSSKEDRISLKKSDTASSSTVPSSTIENHDKFQLDCLNAHNDYRRKHGVGPLKLSPTLSNFAQNWANVCIFFIYSFARTVMNFLSTDNCKEKTIAT